MFEERPGSDRCAENSVAVEFGCMSASTIRDEVRAGERRKTRENISLAHNLCEQ